MAVIEIYWAKFLAILALKRFCKINGIDKSLIINWALEASYFITCSSLTLWLSPKNETNL